MYVFLTAKIYPYEMFCPIKFYLALYNYHENILFFNELSNLVGYMKVKTSHYNNLLIDFIVQAF